MRVRVGAVVTALALLGAVGCSDGESDQVSRPEESAMTAQDWVSHQQRVGDADYVEAPANLQQAVAAADVVVLGTVRDVEPGRGYYVAGDDAAAGTPTAFDAPRASWRSVHGVIDVERVLRGRVDGSTAEVGFTVGARDPFAPAAAGIKSLGRAVFFLQKTPVYDYQPGLYGALFNGSLVATVDGQQQLHLPLMSRLWQHQLLPRPWTLRQLIAVAAERSSS